MRCRFPPCMPIAALLDFMCRRVVVAANADEVRVAATKDIRFFRPKQVAHMLAGGDHSLGRRELRRGGNEARERPECWVHGDLPVASRPYNFRQPDACYAVRCMGVICKIDGQFGDQRSARSVITLPE